MLRIMLSSVFALGLVASGVRADEPNHGGVNLDDLKYAIKVADKRGENVDSIRDALAALEKVLAKGALKPNTTPPELTALRAEVEAAAKKGENVEAIAKELGAIEKALTGSAFVRPKAEPKPEEPVQPFPTGRGGRVVIGGGNRVVINGGLMIGGGKGGLNATSLTISNNLFTIKARQGDVMYTISGSTTGTEPLKIVVQDGDKKTETDDIKKVPEAHRPTVERLLNMIERNGK